MWKEGDHKSKTGQSIRKEPSQFPQIGVRIKKAALTAALDIRLARMHQSPERCARNLMELGQGAFPDKLSMEEQLKVFQELVSMCKSNAPSEARDLFIQSFLA